METQNKKAEGMLEPENSGAASKGARKLVKCIVCGEIFDSALDICPVCGVGREYFVEVEEEKSEFREDTDDYFVIIGNGIAGLSAAEAIRERNKTASVVIVSDEPFDTYNRPMLTKSMMDELDPAAIMVHEDRWYEEKGIERILSQKAVSVLQKEKLVALNDGRELPYTKLIFATGAESFVPPIKGADSNYVSAIRRIADIKKIAGLLSDVKEVAVIGGGVLGLEAAWELKKLNRSVTVLELAPKLMSRQLDEEAGELLKDIADSEGIRICTDVQIDEIKNDGGKGTVNGVLLGSGEIIPAQLVIVSTGVRANTAVAKEAGVNTDKAILVNAGMETNIDGIYACGDCAEYQGVNLAVWPEAGEQGKIAGSNAAGDKLSYEQKPIGLSFHAMNTALYAIGDNGKNKELKYETTEEKDDAKKQYKKYFYVDGKLRGAILIGDLSQMEQINQEISS